MHQASSPGSGVAQAGFPALGIRTERKNDLSLKLTVQVGADGEIIASGHHCNGRPGGAEPEGNSKLGLEDAVAPAWAGGGGRAELVPHAPRGAMP